MDLCHSCMQDFGQGFDACARFLAPLGYSLPLHSSPTTAVRRAVSPQTTSAMELDEGMDAAYAAAMQRLGELKAKPPDELTDAEKKEKLCAPPRRHLDSQLPSEGCVGMQCRWRERAMRACGNACRRLANRESARKLRRKHASQLETGAAEVTRLEAEHAQHQAQLAEGWHRYTELKDENERLMQELQQLRALQVRKPRPLAMQTHHLGSTQVLLSPALPNGVNDHHQSRCRVQAKKVGTSAPPVSAAAPGGATTSAGRVLAGLAAADAAPQPEPAAASGTAPGVAPAPH